MLSYIKHQSGLKEISTRFYNTLGRIIATAPILQALSPRFAPSLFESLVKKKDGKIRLFLAESKGFFRACRLYRLASLVATSAKTVHRTVFFRFAPSLFESLVKKKDGKNRLFWRRARDSNPRIPLKASHDFQSCSFGQLGQLSK